MNIKWTATVALLLTWPLVYAAADSGMQTDRYRRARQRMVASQLEARGIASPAVLAAMRRVPRHLFVPENLQSQAYADRPLPIGEGQTISQPYIVALMTELLQLDESSRVLEIGTGSGYQAAVLARMAAAVYTIEIKPGLYKKTSRLLKNLDYQSINTRFGDGYFGWEQQAPFDGIMVTAAVDHIPPPLIQQLKVGGRLVLPVGNPLLYQHLVLVEKGPDQIVQKMITSVRFVPMTGHALGQ